MKKNLILAVAAVLAVGATAAWKLQHERTEQQATLQARARVSPEAARATALAAVPGGSISEAELEDEDGKLIYSFDIDAADGTHDVEIDAITGTLLQNALENEDERDTDDSDDRSTAQQAKPAH